MGLGTGLAVALAILLFLGAAGWLWTARRATIRQQQSRLAATRSEFFRRREWLEAKFVTVAGSRGTPRGLTWIDCDFDNEVSFARERRSGELTALVGVAIQFKAIAGGGMEDVAAVADRKAATALFRHDGQQWTTEGRAIFNLNPEEAIEFYQSELETVD